MTTTRLLQLHLLFRNPNIEDDDVIVERVAQVRGEQDEAAVPLEADEELVDQAVVVAA